MGEIEKFKAIVATFDTVQQVLENIRMINVMRMNAIKSGLSSSCYSDAQQVLEERLLIMQA